MDFTNIAVGVSEDGSSVKLVVTKTDGSVVEFLDPAGVAAAIAAATTTVTAATVTDAGITVTHSDGTTQTFEPVASEGDTTGQ